ncbi:signal peptidase I [Clostridium luticellarii]|uniref:Signal peptidase I n=1 Tax=Clostridium luticellarii TaxID=1691940 RepID=A0A2T0BRE6_9CLOT|nr:signal peptidase I [Clostridium luticellarii]MCI1943892.1 signal peptidase I [Clostridium luticellarii]MCI1967153.1 signal peptidase I [Clostridium luticellarii]MCI1994520.1 signal peptidase I [Clostridium luticellarii]MCI2038527.1 signal peptidase I [Clostridium luticellarii]PRR86402.1 Signal peptidase I T [Clostridium luticellarii]
MVKELIEIGKSILIAIIAAFLIITFVFETVNVDGHSMDPTLNNGDRLIVEKVSYYFRAPRAGDIVVIKYPANPKEKFIKRVIGVGGDRIKIEDGKLYVNGAVKKEPYILETMTGDFDEVTVPQNTVFVMGDNRNNSRDSRFPDVGFVSYKMVVGRAAFRIYPFSRAGKLSAFQNWKGRSIWL